jgi:hypothetical protein
MQPAQLGLAREAAFARFIAVLQRAGGYAI